MKKYIKYQKYYVGYFDGDSVILVNYIENAKALSDGEIKHILMNTRWKNYELLDAE